ncbi:GPCR fungal pheromone mating factor [Mycena rebaudengoi]|nr:GPCR fungal pheromone mating factor [Mycena rebaudengoi]
MHPELPIGAFIAVALVLVPLPWHWRARNTTGLSMMAWLFVSNLTYAINSIIWAGRVDEVVPVWCDIVGKFDIGATVALPGCYLSLALQLWRVLSASHTTNKRSVLLLGLFLCWGFPVITMALHYIYQGHRFDIIEDFGCRATFYLSVPAIVLFYVPIAAIVVLTFIFTALAFRAFYIHRRAFTAILQSTNSALTTARYVRLMVNIIVLTVWETFVIGIVFGFNFRNGIKPYTSWADVHWGFSRANQVPMALIPKRLRVWFYIVWWTIPLRWAVVLLRLLARRGRRG